jgi:hypothetical protein
VSGSAIRLQPDSSHTVSEGGLVHLRHAELSSQLAVASSGERWERMPYGSGGDDGERGHVARPYVVEVSAVDGGNGGGAMPFGDPPQVGLSEVH